MVFYLQYGSANSVIYYISAKVKPCTAQHFTSEALQSQVSSNADHGHGIEICNFHCCPCSVNIA